MSPAADPPESVCAVPAETTQQPMYAMPIAAARKAFLGLPEVVKAGPVLIMRHGRPVMALLSVDQFEGMLETIEMLSDRAFAQRLRMSFERAKIPP